MKKIIAILAIISFVGCNKIDEITLSSSDKSTVMFTENGAASKTFPRFSYVPDASLTDQYISFDAYTIKAKYDGPAVAPADISLTYAVDAASVAKFNADGAAANPSFKPFTLLPASNFSLLVTADVIKKGEVYAPKVTNNIVTHPTLIDPAKNYVIPISVKSSSVSSATGSGTIFFTIIGNPLAGAYNVTGYFYHPSSPRAFSRTGASGALSPVSDVALVTELGDLGASGYYAVLTVPDPYGTSIMPVTISVYPGSISPVYQWDTGLPAANPGYTPAWGMSALCNNTYNPTTKTFYLRYGYLGGTGYRVTEEILVKQ